MEDAYRKKQANIQKQYEEQKKINEENAAKEKQLSDESYESDYQWWKNDVEQNPDKYSLSTRAAVMASKQGAAFDALSRLLFGLKNRAGNIAQNSIDTNGTRY